jgi:ribosome-associated translation inhibitor RaiA
MDKENFPIEYNNEIDDVKKSENEIYTLAVDRLSKLSEGHDDISGGVVNLKQPAQGHQTSYIYEVTIVVYMGSDHIAATKKVKQIQSTLDSALDAVEKQVRERRKQQQALLNHPDRSFNMVKHSAENKKSRSRFLN